MRRRVAIDDVDPAGFHEQHAHLVPATALAELEATAPAAEDLVVCHGDDCPPNMLLQAGRVTGYVDLGELGAADRWWDVAVGPGAWAGIRDVSRARCSTRATASPPTWLASASTDCSTTSSPEPAWGTGPTRLRATLRSGDELRARVNTASNIGTVSLPVNVFCWLGWYEPSRVTPDGSGLSAR